MTATITSPWPSGPSSRPGRRRFIWKRPAILMGLSAALTPIASMKRICANWQPNGIRKKLRPNDLSAWLLSSSVLMTGRCIMPAMSSTVSVISAIISSLIRPGSAMNNSFLCSRTARRCSSICMKMTRESWSSSRSISSRPVFLRLHRFTKRIIISITSHATAITRPLTTPLWPMLRQAPFIRCSPRLPSMPKSMPVRLAARCGWTV